MANKPEYSQLGNTFYIRSWTFHALDIPGGDASNNRKIEMHGHHGGANQTWIIKEA